MMNFTICMTNRPVYWAGTHVPGNPLGICESIRNAQFIIDWSQKNVSLSQQNSGPLPDREPR